MFCYHLLFCCEINYLLLLAKNGKNEISAQSENTCLASKYAPSLKIRSQPQNMHPPSKYAPTLKKMPILNKRPFSTPRTLNQINKV